MIDIIKYPRTPHLEGSRLQPGDEDLAQVALAELRGAHLVIEEKVDGANAGLRFDAAGRIYLQSRGHFLTGGGRERHFDLFKQWADVHRGALFEVLGARYVLYGEWLYAKHTIFYDLLPHYFVTYDLLDLERGKFLSTPARRRVLDGLPLAHVAVLAEGPAPTNVAALRALVGRSRYQSPGWREALAEAAAQAGVDHQRAVRETDPEDAMEGLYVKHEVGDELVGRYKWIRATYLQAVADSGSHWLSRPIIPNRLAPGVDLFELEMTALDPTASWDDLDRAFDWIRRLRDVPQDPRHHGEGDVWIHTRMVLEALVSGGAFRALASDDDRRVAWLAALLHDVAKPDCTATDMDGSIHARGHSAKGALLARRILWEERVPFATRERVCAIVRNHQVPFFLLERPDADVLQRRVALTAPARLLAAVADADGRGRVAADQQRLLDNVALFAESCAEGGCLDAPPAFASDHTRLRYFQSSGKVAPDWPQHERFRCEVVLMSGLPGAGKDAWVRRHLPGWPVISLDNIREELDVDPRDDQNPVAHAAREAARAHLRAGRSFVWNATNLSRQLRAMLISLFLDYDARVRIVYVEAPPDVLRRQNRERERPVPSAVLERMLARWEAPDLTEAHQVDYVIAGGAI